jgi:hypothetical protein
MRSMVRAMYGIGWLLQSMYNHGPAGSCLRG